MYRRCHNAYDNRSPNNQPNNNTEPQLNIQQDEGFLIGRHAFTLPTEEGRIFQKDMREMIRRLLENGLLPQGEIARLHEKGYSNDMLGISHPLFVDTHKDILDNAGHARYWKTPIGGYYVCSQWWMDKFQHYNKISELVRNGFLKCKHLLNKK